MLKVEVMKKVEWDYERHKYKAKLSLLCRGLDNIQTMLSIVGECGLRIDYVKLCCKNNEVLKLYTIRYFDTSEKGLIWLVDTMNKISDIIVSKIKKNKNNENIEVEDIETWFIDKNGVLEVHY